MDYFSLSGQAILGRVQSDVVNALATPYDITEKVNSTYFVRVISEK